MNQVLSLTRRDAIRAALLTTASCRTLRAETPLTQMGIADTSFFFGPGSPKRDPFQLLERCHSLGSSGIQTRISGDIPKLRARAEELGMYIEGMISLPKIGDTQGFEQGIQDAKEAGATVLRCAALGGRRYEVFDTLADWKQHTSQAFKAIEAALPILESHKMTLALENHKDWTQDELAALLKTYSSEYLGVCFDFGNNIALLDDPMQMLETLAPYVRSTHVKDMGVRMCVEGFLLSEVPLGTGILDLPRMIHLIQKTTPRTHLTLEMITRDPLKVPCLSDKYWTTFPDRNGQYLARALRLVGAQDQTSPLPVVSGLAPEIRTRLDEDNIKICERYSRAKLGV